MLDFIPACPPDNPVPNNQDLPKEMTIYMKSESDFLPAGKTFSDLTPEELEMLKMQYKYSYFRPGLYQTITGVKGSI